MQVEWGKLATEIGSINMYGSQLSLDAIEKLLGEDFFAQAVDYCISLEEGWCLPEGVLKILRPLGMKHCYHIYKTSSDIEEKRGAAWLLKYISDRKVLEYIPEFLADPDEQIQFAVIQILDQMLFYNAIKYEDIIPILELAANHPNEELRRLAVGLVNEETIQGLTDFTANLTDALGKELSQWKRRLKFETIHGLDLRCIPWHGQLELSFLTAQEDFDLSEAYSEKFYPKWRLNDLPLYGREIDTARQWMEKEFEKSGASLQYLEIFLSACATVLKSSRIQKILRKYNLSQDFQITVFSPSSSFPMRNFYLTIDASS